MEDFPYSNHMEVTANDWNPQTGSTRQFDSGTGYPRAGVGKLRDYQLSIEDNWVV